MKTKTKTRVLSLLMTLAMLLTSFVVVIPASAEETTPSYPTTSWADNAATAYAGGDGSKENPYRIENAAQLAYLSKMVTSDEYDQKFFILADADGNPVTIDLSAHQWVSIGNWANSKRFKASFEGNGSTITGLTYTGTISDKGQSTALFGAVGSNATIQNFNLTNVKIDVTVSKAEASSAIGAVVGFHSGAVWFKNINAYVDIDVEQRVGSPRIGGFVGAPNNSYAENCTVSGTIDINAVVNDTTTYEVTVGGFAGLSSGVINYKNVTNNVDITVTKGKNNCIIGGILAGGGRNGSNTSCKTDIVDSLNTGTIKVTDYSAKGTGSDNARIGGIVGNVGRNGSGSYYFDANITRCVNVGTFSVTKIDANNKKTNATKTGTGGSGGIAEIVGFQEGSATTTLSQCYSTNLKFYSNSDLPFHIRGSSAYVAVASGVKKSGYLISADSDISLEAGIYATNANKTTVAVTKNSLDALMATGFTMTLTYGENTVTATKADYASKLTANGKLYTIDFDTVKDAYPTLTVNKNHTDGSSTAHTANKLSWAGVATDTSLPAAVENVITISNAYELAALALTVNKGWDYMSGKTVKLNADINLAGYEWMPIGMVQGERSFFGTFEGNNKTVDGLTLTETNNRYSQSMFGYGNNSTVIQNFTLTNPIIEAAQIKGGTVNAVATLMAASYGATVTNVDVVNLDFNVNGSFGELFYGGLIGYFAPTISSDVHYPSTVKDCDVQGTIEVITSGTAMVGGLVARGREGSITNCTSNLAINVSSISKGGSIEYFYVGGFIGKIMANADSEVVEVKNCVNHGDITVIANLDKFLDEEGLSVGKVGVGGFVGGATITSTFSGSLTVKNCVNNGKVSVSSDYADATLGAGGIIGLDDFSVNATLTIDNCVDLANDKLVGAVVNEDPEHTYAGYADTLELTTLEGARVRIAIDGETGNLDNSGIRFDSYISKEVVDALIAKGYKVTFGTVIAKESTLAAANGNWDALVDGTTKVVVEYDLTKHEYVNGDGYNFTGALIKVQEKNYKENLTAVAYMTITIAEGVSFTVYGDATTTRSIATVAERALADQKANYSDAQKAILETYLGK